jgi:hypothetical protein
MTTMKMRKWGGVAASAALMGAAFSLYAAPAYASTLNGTATITDASLNPLSSGGSTTQFSVVLPANAACTGDTATGGYHVYSYLVPQGTDVTTLTFTSHPSTGFGFVNNAGVYYGPINTAINTGQIPTTPTNFEWGPWVSVDGVTVSTLLQGGTSGTWEAGLACANSSGVLTDYWNTVVTFSASGSDPNGFVWTVGPGTSTPEAPWSAVLPVAGVLILGGGFWVSRRRSARKAALVSQTAGT